MLKKSEYYADLIEKMKEEGCDQATINYVMAKLEKTKEAEEKLSELEKSPMLRAQNKIDSLIKITKEKYPTVDLDKVRVFFDIRSTRLAGQHQFRRPNHNVRYNPDFLETFTEDFIERTIPHEWAHMIVSAMGLRNRGDAHGVFWRSVCKTLGMKDTAIYHTYGLVDAQRSKDE